MEHYSPELTMSFKKGNQRDIGRLSILVPVLQNETKLLHITMIGMHDSKPNIEGNFGLGFRQLLPTNGIWGVYGFYDLRRTKKLNLMHQLTFGAEWLSSNYEVRVNGYLPLTTSFLLGGHSTTTMSDIIESRTERGPRHIIVSKGKVDRLELGMGGFDMEYGYNLNIPNTMTYLTYYHFANKDEKQSIDGARIRLEYKLTDILKLEGEYSYDNQRKSAYYGGFTINIALGTKTKKLSTLMKKMTQLPVRDVDIVTETILHPHENELRKFIVIDSAEELAKISTPHEQEYALNAKYVQTADIILSDVIDGESNHVPIGTQNTPFMGEYYGMYRDVRYCITNLRVESDEIDGKPPRIPPMILK